MRVEAPRSTHKDLLAAESDDAIRFHKSLQELRDLRSQLHHAADCCESTFLESVSDERKIVVDNTRKYICRALVTMVDHVGTVSANLDTRMSAACEFTDAELRINFLKQRLQSCEEYANRVALKKVRWDAILPSHNARYLLTITNIQGSDEVSRDTKNPNSKGVINHDSRLDEGVPLFLYTHNNKQSLAKHLTAGVAGKNIDTKSSLVPVRDGLSILSKSINPTFHFQGTQKVKSRDPNRKSAHSSDILALIRRIRRTT